MLMHIELQHSPLNVKYFPDKPMLSVVDDYGFHSTMEGKAAFEKSDWLLIFYPPKYDGKASTYAAPTSIVEWDP